MSNKQTDRICSMWHLQLHGNVKHVGSCKSYLLLAESISNASFVKAFFNLDICGISFWKEDDMMYAK